MRSRIGARKAPSAGPPAGLRSAVGPWGPDCAAMLGPVVPPRNSLHSLRSCHSDTRGEPEVEAREYARGPRALRFSPPPMRPANGPAHGALRGETC